MNDKIQQFYYKKSRIQQLKGFCYTVQKGSSKNAAEKMGLDPSTISLQIKSLEEDLGINLFDRKGKKLILNEKGKEFYQRAAKCLQSVDNLFDNFLLSEDEKYQNSLNIAGNSIILSHLLPKYLAEFHKKYPNIQISLNNINKEECKQQILDNKIDLGVYIFLLDEKIPLGLDVLNYKSYKAYWIMNKNHPLTKKLPKDITETDIANTNFTYIPELVTMENFKRYIKKYNILNYIKTKNCNLELLQNLVNEGLCIGCIPAIYYNKNNKNIVAKTISNTFEHENSYYGIFLKKENKKKTLNDFLEIISEK